MTTTRWSSRPLGDDSKPNEPAGRGSAPDRWSRWLLERRDAGDERQRAITLEALRPIRDRVLELAGPLEGATLLDVGAGDGLIGLEALQRVGARGRVIFSDVSPALLDHLRAIVGADDRATFVQAAAEDLAPIPDASVDVVTTRSVLIYVDDKAAAFAAMRRVLRPGGRISLFEPINALMFPEPSGRFWGYDVRGAEELADRVSEVFAAVAQPAMRDFDDRDLARLAEAAGFGHVHVETHTDIEPGSIMRAVDLDALLDGAPNPNAPTVREAIATALDAGEQQRFLDVLGAAIDAGPGVRRTVAAYVAAALEFSPPER